MSGRPVQRSKRAGRRRPDVRRLVVLVVGGAAIAAFRKYRLDAADAAFPAATARP